MEPVYYTCILCTCGRGIPEAILYHHDHPWVGTFDAHDLLGECPQCGSSVGVMPLAEAPPEDQEAARAVIVLGQVDHLDAEPPLPNPDSQDPTECLGAFYRALNLHDLPTAGRLLSGLLAEALAPEVWRESHLLFLSRGGTADQMESPASLPTTEEG